LWIVRSLLFSNRATRRPPFDGATDRSGVGDFFTPTIGPPRGDTMAGVWRSRQVLSRVIAAAPVGHDASRAKPARGDTIS
jgi:hypothetical protein